MARFNDAGELEIYFNDLSPRVQEMLVEFLGDNGNYDAFPLATIMPNEPEAQHEHQ